MSLKSGEYPWCVCNSDGNIVSFDCMRCKQFFNFNNTGMTIDRFVEMSEAFCMLHKDCKEERLKP